MRIFLSTIFCFFILAESGQTQVPLGGSEEILQRSSEEGRSRGGEVEKKPPEAIVRAAALVLVFEQEGKNLTVQTLKGESGIVSSIVIDGFPTDFVDGGWKIERTKRIKKSPEVQIFFKGEGLLTICFKPQNNPFQGGVAVPFSFLPKKETYRVEDSLWDHVAKAALQRQ